MYGDALTANPLAWVQIRLLGGWRRVLGVGGVWAAAIFLLLVFVYRALRDTIPLSGFAFRALAFLTVIEAVILFFGGVGAIRKAIHRDFTSDMTLSHRLTGMTGYSAVLGYMTGATGQIWALTIVSCAACTVLAFLSGIAISVYAPIAFLASMLPLVIMLWTLAVLVGLSTRGSTSIVGLLVLLVFMIRLGGVVVVPGFAVLVNYPTISRIMSSSGAPVDDPWVVIGFLEQSAVAMLLFVAAARKYTRDDVPALTTRLAYLALALAATILALGLAHWPGVGGSPNFGIDVQVIATLVVLALSALLPIACAARADAAWTARRARDPGHAEPAPGSYLRAPFVATVIGLGVFAAVIGKHMADLTSDGAPTSMSRSYASVVAAFFLALVTLGGLLRYTYSIMPKAAVILFVSIALLWVTPPIADMGLAASSSLRGYSAILGMSPVGTWIIAMGGGDGASMWPGLGFQFVVALAAVGLARWGARTRRS